MIQSNVISNTINKQHTVVHIEDGVRYEVDIQLTIGWDKNFDIDDLGHRGIERYWIEDYEAEVSIYVDEVNEWYDFVGDQADEIVAYILNNLNLGEMI